MSAIFTSIINIFAVPFGIVMRYIFQFVGDYGLSVILFSILAKLVMMPLTIKQKRSMMKTQAIQPKIQELQRKHGKDQAKLNQEVQELYAREGVSPMSGCGSSLLTLPVMLGLYYVISQPLTYFMRITQAQISEIAEILGFTVGTGYGAQVSLAGEIFAHFDKVAHVSENLLRVDYNFLGINLAATPDWKVFNLLWLIPVISGLTAFIMSWVTMKLTRRPDADPNDQMAKTSNMMMMTMPLMSVFFGFTLPAGLGLYWITNNIVSSIQEVVLQKFLLKKKDDLNQ